MQRSLCSLAACSLILAGCASAPLPGAALDEVRIETRGADAGGEACADFSLTSAQALAAARKQFGDDPANAAALREASSSIASRYNALGELDECRIRSAQKALDDWDRAAAVSAAQAAEAASIAASH